ncbi:hypothetical protein AOQ84DRAFT_380127 [Glonium stellatum]|uniref:Nascent polypeptide-associated complex subunit alpha-like UBA domain-containing protein n=1 Tax=Glonium stellatum TaxID=574774 RepID=A0A8E2EU28_9PEZI|nr:hypothetical protein AOQ84DRAFT_380127 [Glonium stellatum]
MAEEQPASVHEGASTPPPPTGTAEDRKAAAALSSLDAHDDDGTAKSGADSEALGQAMEKLNVGGAKEEQKVVPRRAVKVDPADVNMLVEQLELSKVKATELLKAHDGNIVKAMSAFITASA